MCAVHTAKKWFRDRIEIAAKGMGLSDLYRSKGVNEIVCHEQQEKTVSVGGTLHTDTHNSFKPI